MTEQGGQASVPTTDPTHSTTTEQLDRAVKAERDYVDGRNAVILERLDGIDRATKVLHDSMTRVPTDVQQAVGHLKELHDEKFSSVAQRFSSNQTAIDAALSAQKEAAASQEESNAKAIDKSEKATAEAIGKLGELFATTNKGFTQQIDDIKASIAEVRQLINGAAQNRAGGTEQKTDTRALVTFGIGAILFLITVAGFVIALMSNKPA